MAKIILFILNNEMTIDLIAIWGQYIIDNDNRQISNAIMFGKIAERMNTKYNSSNFNAGQLLRKSHRLKANYTKVCINYILYII